MRRRMRYYTCPEATSMCLMCLTRRLHLLYLPKEKYRVWMRAGWGKVPLLLLHWDPSWGTVTVLSPALSTGNPAPFWTPAADDDIFHPPVSFLTFRLCLILQVASISYELSGRWLYLMLVRTGAKVCCNLLWNICDFCCAFYCTGAWFKVSTEILECMCEAPSLLPKPGRTCCHASNSNLQGEPLNGIMSSFPSTREDCPSSVLVLCSSLCHSALQEEYISAYSEELRPMWSCCTALGLRETIALDTETAFECTQQENCRSVFSSWALASSLLLNSPAEVTCVVWPVLASVWRFCVARMVKLYISFTLSSRDKVHLNIQQNFV